MNCLAKHSRPDVAGEVRELAKVVDGATVQHMNPMEQVMKFVLDKNDLETLTKAVMRPDTKCVIETQSDSDFGGDKKDQKRCGKTCGACEWSAHFMEVSISKSE